MYASNGCSLADVDLVVHAAGPFQQAGRCTVLEAAIHTKVRRGNYQMLFCCCYLQWRSCHSILSLMQLTESKCCSNDAYHVLQTAYIDVCDDTSYAFRAKSLCKEAVKANVSAITTAGIYPGVSNGSYVE